MKRNIKALTESIKYDFDRSFINSQEVEKASSFINAVFSVPHAYTVSIDSTFSLHLRGIENSFDNFQLKHPLLGFVFTPFFKVAAPLLGSYYYYCEQDSFSCFDVFSSNIFLGKNETNSKSIIHETIHALRGEDVFVGSADFYLSRAIEVYYMIINDDIIPFSSREGYDINAFHDGEGFFMNPVDNPHSYEISWLNSAEAEDLDLSPELLEKYDTGMFVAGILSAMLKEGYTQNDCVAFINYLSSGEDVLDALNNIKN